MGPGASREGRVNLLLDPGLRVRCRSQKATMELAGPVGDIQSVVREFLRVRAPPMPG